MSVCKPFNKKKQSEKKTNQQQERNQEKSERKTTVTTKRIGGGAKEGERRNIQFLCLLFILTAFSDFTSKKPRAAPIRFVLRVSDGLKCAHGRRSLNG